jgi:hypothetical protein
MGFLSGIFLLIIILSVTVASSYMQRNDISFEDLFDGSSSIQYGNDWNFNGNFIFNQTNKSSDYETRIIEKNETFDIVDELFISTTIEEVVFVEEDRSDILVEYYRESPDTGAYDVKYKTSSTSNKLSVSTSLSIRNLRLNKEYKGKITIHIPSDYIFEKVTLDSGAAKIRTENIYSKTRALSIIASFGDIDITTDSPIEKVNVRCNLGSITLNVNKPINDLYIDCEMGDIKINTSSIIEYVSVVNNMGSINADFLENISGATFENNMGDINVTFHKNDDMAIYIDTNLGDTSSDYSTTSSNNTNFSFMTNMGSIKVKDH